MTEIATRPAVELVSAPPVERRIADYLIGLLGEARPRRVSQMFDPGGDKYRDLPKSKPLTSAMLVEHASGTSTYAASLECGRIGAADIDRDTPAAGKAELMARYRDIRAAGLQAIAIYVENALGQHYGGHIFGFYAERCDPDALAAQWRGILPTVAEIWPCGQVIRLPFGYHRWAKTRGEMWYIADSGELLTFDLDQDLQSGFALVEQLPQNSAPPKVQQTTDKVHSAKIATAAWSIRESPGERAAGRASLDDVKARFNAEHTWPELLSAYGGTETRDGWACNCGWQHTHATQIAITSQGKIVSFSPNCRWAPHKDSGYALDKFGFYCDQAHGGNVVSALKALNPIQPRKARPEAPQHATVYRTAQQDADAEHKRAERRAAATAARDKVAEHAKTDDRLTPCDRATLQAMLDWAAEHNAIACWAGRSTIARRAGYSVGAVKRSTMLLEAYGYFASEGSGGAQYQTAKRTFTRGSLFADETIVDTTNDPRNHEYIACEGALSSPACENVYAETLDDWQWSDDQHSADELTMLDQSEAAPAVEPDPEYSELLVYVYALSVELGQPRDYAGYSFEALEAEAIRLSAMLDQPAELQKVCSTDNSSADLPQQEAVNDVSIKSRVADTNSDQPEGASYTPVELPANRTYTGGNKHALDLETRYALVRETVRLLPDAEPIDQAEQLSLDAPSLPSARRRGDKPSAADRYLVELACMSESELAGELRKHNATLRKHAGAPWLRSIRAKRDQVEQEISARDMAGAAPDTRALTSYSARKLVQPSGMQQAFI